MSGSPNRRARRAAFAKHEKAARRGQAAVLDIRFRAEGDHIVMSIEESTGITRHHVLSADATAITADRAALACDQWDAAQAPDPEPGSAGAELLAEAAANVAAGIPGSAHAR